MIGSLPCEWCSNTLILTRPAPRLYLLPSASRSLHSAPRCLLLALCCLLLALGSALHSPLPTRSLPLTSPHDSSRIAR